MDYRESTMKKIILISLLAVFGSIGAQASNVDEAAKKAAAAQKQVVKSGQPACLCEHLRGNEIKMTPEQLKVLKNGTTK